MIRLIFALLLIPTLCLGGQGMGPGPGMPAGTSCANNIAFTAGSSTAAQSSYGGLTRTLTKTVTAGDFVIVVVTGTAGLGAVTVTDNADTPNTYTGLTKRVYSGTSVNVQVFYSHITTSKTSAVITATAASNSGYMRVMSGTFTGVATSSFTDIDTYAYGNSTSVSVSSGTLSVCSELVIAAAAIGATGVTDTSGMSSMSAYNTAHFTDYKIVTSKDSTSFTATVDNTTNWVVSIVTFKSN